MRFLISSIIFSVAIAFAGDALADEPVKLQLRIEPAANDAELDKLMRQNTVRVALQRHRLWQEAMESEQAREEKQVREQRRDRVKTADAKPDTAPTTGDDVAVPGDKAKGDGEGEGDGDGEQMRERHRHQNRTGEEGAKGTAKGVTDRTRLRNMLREERLTSGDDKLEQKLQQRLREYKRQTDRAKSGDRKQEKKGSGRGKRSGR